MTSASELQPWFLRVELARTVERMRQLLAFLAVERVTVQPTAMLTETAPALVPIPAEMRVAFDGAEFAFLYHPAAAAPVLQHLLSHGEQTIGAALQELQMAKRVDAFQATAVGVLRARGCTVQVLSAVGQGVPDLLVGVQGVNLLIELKMPNGSLTPDQVDWHRGWNGQVVVCFSAGDCLDAVDRALRLPAARRHHGH